MATGIFVLIGHISSIRLRLRGTVGWWGGPGIASTEGSFLALGTTGSLLLLLGLIVDLGTANWALKLFVGLLLFDNLGWL